MHGPNDSPDSDERLLARLAAAPPVQPELARVQLYPGDLIGRSYRVEGTLGRGGMGVVYRARDLELDRPVAIKLHAHRTSASTAERLVNEAKAMAKLSHPNVLTVYEVGRHQVVRRGTGARQYCLFIAMELIEGTTLANWLREFPHPWKEITRMFVEAGKGLAAAHRVGLVHRDFKPDNVLIDTSGRPRVADFGIARMPGGSKQSDSPATESNVIEHTQGPTTKEGVVLGTRAYMAPEQAGRSHDVDARADQYSFCVSLFEGLHGRRPNESADTNPSPSPAPFAGRGRVPRRLQSALERGLSSEPDDRFASMDALLGELDAIMAPRARPRLVALAVGSLAATTGWFALRTEEHPCDPEPALDGAWSEKRAEAVEQALRESGGPLGVDVAPRVRKRLDDYAAHWSAAYQETCDSTYRRHVRSQEAFDLRMSCLERRREELAALSTLLLDANPELAGRADRAVLALPSVGRCSDLDSLRRVEPEPEAEHERVLELRRTLARAKAARDTGSYETSLRLAESALAEAEALDYWAARGWALLSVGRAQSKLGRHEEAGADYERAISAAVRAGDESTALDAAVAQVYTQGYQLRRPELSRSVLSLADAWLHRLDTEPMLAVRRHLNEGLTLRAEGRLKDAHRALAEASRQSKVLPGDDAREAQRQIAAARAVTHAHQGQLDEAVEAHREALQLTETIYGPYHPSVANELSNLGGTLIRRGDYEGAVQPLKRALDILEPVLSSGHPQALRVSNNLAQALTLDGRNDEAIDVLEAAATQTRDVDLRIEASLQLSLATAYGEEGRTDDARPRYQLALATARKDDPSGPFVLRVLATMARFENRQGNYDGAATLAREGLEIGLRSSAEGLGAVASLLHLHLADALAGVEDWAGACEHHALALERMTRHYDAPPHLGAPLRGLAQCHLELGEPREAETYADQALASAPEDNWTRFLLARILWARGKRAQARLEATRARDGVQTKDDRAMIDGWLAEHPS